MSISKCGRIDVILSNVVTWNHRSIPSVCLSIIVNHIIIHIFFFMNFSIIGRVTVCKFIWVFFVMNRWIKLNPVSGESSILDNVIFSIPFIFDFLIISSISISNIIGFFLDLCLNLYPVSCKTSILNYIVFSIPLILNFFVISSVCIGNIIRLLPHFLTNLHPVSSKTSILDNIVFTIPFILNFFVISKICICNIIWFSSDDCFFTKNNKTIIIKRYFLEME